MKAIVGRLSELGLRELFRLLTSVRAEGVLQVENAAGTSELQVRHGHVAGPITPTLQLAVASRIGTFMFRPRAMGDAEWVPMEEFQARLDVMAAQLAGSAVAEFADPLAELRDSLAEVPLPEVGGRVTVISADPRPYRTMEPVWRQRGWQLTLLGEPDLSHATPGGLLLLHLPSAGTLAGHGDQWLALVKHAKALQPPASVVWLGGLADPRLRHEAVMAGVDFLLPAPVGDVGEAAKWFREEITAVVERMLAPRVTLGGEGQAFRDFFLALHLDAPPAEVRASLLRFAGHFFRRGLLLAVREQGFDPLGEFGFHGASLARLSRGLVLLEEAVIGRAPVDAGQLSVADRTALTAALDISGSLEDAVAFPLLSGRESVAVLVGDGRVSAGEDLAGLAALLARSGPMLGL